MLKINVYDICDDNLHFPYPRRSVWVGENHYEKLTMNKWYPRKKQNRFCNIPDMHLPESLLFGTLPSFLKSLIGRLQRKPFKKEQWITPHTPIERSYSLRISWIGHATFLIQAGGYNLITDPVFGNVSPIFPRLLTPGIPLEMLPPIDYVLISHNHRDHMDRHSLCLIKQNNPNVTVLVPQGDKPWFGYHKFKNTHEHTWWDTTSVSDSFTCTFLPSVHWSQRGFFDKNRSLWGSWMITAQDKLIYFAGDTAYGDHFSQIAHEFPLITVALIPIGPCEPSEWMKLSHLNSETALQAFVTLQAKHFVPMHWGTFPFGNDQFEDPIIRLKRAWKEKEHNLRNQKLHIIKAGDHRCLDK